MTIEALVARGTELIVLRLGKPGQSSAAGEIIMMMLKVTVEIELNLRGKARSGRLG